MLYRPGTFAKLIGVSTTTLRNWDKQGILKPALKTPGGERRYSEEQLQQILQNKSKYRIVTTQFVRNVLNETKKQDKDTTTNKSDMDNKSADHEDATTNEPTPTNKSDTTNKDTTSQSTKTIKTDSKTTTTNKSDVTSQVCTRTSYIYEFQTKPNVSQSRINIGYARVSSQKQEDDLKRQIDLLELFLVRQGKSFKIISDIGYGIDYSKPGLKELLRLISTNQVDTVYILYKDRLVRCGFELIEEVAKLHGTEIEVINQTIEKIDIEELVDDIVNFVSMFSYILSCQTTSRKKVDINEKIIQRLSGEKEKQ